MQNSKCKILVSIIFLFSVFHFSLSVFSQVRPIYDQGAVGLGQLLKRLNNTKSVMHIGAHPDDEDSDLLAYLARAENARTVYLSLTRGDGGQNVIGSELFESLGIIRTEELLQARRLDGGEQLFTRAFDYGFSKTLAEAKEKWDEKEILCDTVRAIRTFRPLVVISRFSGTPADGHGQHQYAGYIAPLAVKAAADANQCKDSGTSWQVLKFYVSQGFRDTSEPTLKINTGKYDFLLGRSYYEIAAEGRSQHKTQEQGGLELKGDRFSGLNLVESKVSKVANEKSVFDGIDTSLSGITKILSENEKTVNEFTREKLNKIQPLLEKVLNKYDSNDTRNIVPMLAEAKRLLNDLLLSYVKFSDDPTPIEKFEKKWKNEINIMITVARFLSDAEKAIKLASGLQIDALANQETVTASEIFLTSVKIFYPENSNIKIKEVKLNAPSGWQISNSEEPKNDSSFARFFRETANDSKYFNVKVAPNAKLTEPYFLENPRQDYLYVWNDGENKNKPFQKPLVTAEVTAEIDGTEITFMQPVEYRYADDVRGEVRRDLNIVPKVSLKLDQDLIIAPRDAKPQKHKVKVSLTNNSGAEISGKVYLNLPNGQRIEMMKLLKGDDWFKEVKDWTVAPKSSDFVLSKKGENASFEFEIAVPPFSEPHLYEVEAVAEVGGEKFTQVLNEVAYSHIQMHRFYTDAKTKFDVLDLKVAPVKVGYIMGSGDAIPEAIRQMGLNVEMLGENDLTNGDFSRFDVIVVGIRASEVRADFIANNQRLLNYVKNGGTLIVQYQKNAYLSQNLTPFPAKMAARVVDENARVTILEPNSPVFNFPNKITNNDFAGWVQERNLYAFTTFDERYTPLLEAHDAGEPENKGGMVYAEIGKGKFVYTSYAFFRQLPAGVPGAYRLFANLLSLPKAKK